MGGVAIIAAGSKVPAFGLTISWIQSVSPAARLEAISTLRDVNEAFGDIDVLLGYRAEA